MMQKTIKNKIKVRIDRSKCSVFTPMDFLDLARRGYAGRVLSQLVADGCLIRFGLGLYAKAKTSPITGKIVPVKPLPELAKEALTQKLNIEVVDSEELSRYNIGESRQVPTGRVIAVKGRVSRKMAYDGKSIKFSRIS